MKPRHTAYLYLLLVSVIWGAASPVVKNTLTWFDPWIFLTYRFAVSTAIAVPYLWLARTPMPKKSSDWGLVLLTALVSAPLSLWLFFEALSKTTALSGSLLTAVGPLLMILGGAIFFRDRVTHSERIGITITIMGALVTVVGPLIINGQMDTLGRFEGNLIMLAAVSMDIVAALLSKQAMQRKINATFLAQSQFVLGLVLFLPFLLSLRPAGDIWNVIATAPLEAHLGVFFMAVLSGTIAYTLRNMAVKIIEISESALFNYLQPLWGAILAVLWLGEPITKSYVVGGLVIAIGVVIAEHKRSKGKGLF